MDFDQLLDGFNWLSVVLVLMNAVVAWLEMHQGLVGMFFTIFMGLSTLYWTKRRVLALEKQAEKND